MFVGLTAILKCEYFRTNVGYFTLFNGKTRGSDSAKAMSRANFNSKNVFETYWHLYCVDGNRMDTVTKPATKTETRTESHLIGKFIGNVDGPTLVAVGSIHGNEPSGRLALERVARRVETLVGRLRGRVYLLAGNIRASAKGVRFLDADLNRHSTRENIRRNTRLTKNAEAEDNEQYELLTIFREILNSAVDEVYVMDLHSTSADGVPFATVGDTLRNRHFARKLPVTMLLGIEEQLEGTMLEFLNNEGTVTLGFEAGQHLSEEAIDNHQALVMHALVSSGILAPEDVPGLFAFRKRLMSATGKAHIFEVRHREPVSAEDDFQMDPGYRNFDPIKRGQRLAANKHGTIFAPESGSMLMPLYQKQGDDGFFIVRTVSAFWLGVSETVRRLKLADYTHWLPGVRRHPRHSEMLQIDTRIARFFPLQIFHLLGFRRLRWQQNFLVVSRRRYDTTSPFGSRRN